MKIQLLVLCVFHANVWGTIAFSLKASKASSHVVLKSFSTDNMMNSVDPFGTRMQGGRMQGGNTAPEVGRSSSTESSTEEMFPVDLSFKTMQGGNTVLTYQLPAYAERVQYVIKSNGRPVDATVGLWLGPQRQTHTMECNLQDGSTTPFQGTLKFKLGPPVLKITTGASLAFPISIAVSVPSAERSKELGAITDKVWASSQKTIVQGGSVDAKGGGAVRIFPVAFDVESVQVLFWSKDTGKKSLKATIEVLNGPNTTKQVYNLQCGGGSQPYHCVIQTPGQGSQLRIINKKFQEDGLFQVAVVPYKYTDTGAFAGATTNWYD